MKELSSISKYDLKDYPYMITISYERFVIHKINKGNKYVYDYTNNTFIDIPFFHNRKVEPIIIYDSIINHIDEGYVGTSEELSDFLGDRDENIKIAWILCRLIMEK